MTVTTSGPAAPAASSAAASSARSRRRACGGRCWACGGVAQWLGPLDAPGHDAGRTTPGRPPGLADLLRAAHTRPTLLALEDAQWLDEPSLHWLGALSRRWAGAPLAVLCGGSRLGAPDPDWHDLLAAAPGAATAHHLVLSPLGPDQVAAAVARAFGRWGDEEFLAAAGRATGGHPGILDDTLRQFAWHGHRPVAARVPELGTLAATVTGDHLMRALRGLTREVVAVVRALAVCGGLLDFPLVCALAGLDTIGEPRLRAVLAQLPGIGTGDGTGTEPRLAPAVRSRVLTGASATERIDLHTRAAELAYRAAVDDVAVADLLLGTRRIGRPWALRALRIGAEAAAQRQDHRHAATLLGRALEEDPPPAEHARLVLELSAAHLLGEPEAGDHRLDAIVRRAGTDGALRVRAADLGLTGGATAVVRRAVADVLPGAGGPEQDDLLALFWCTEPTGQGEIALPVPEVPPLPPQPASPAQAAVRAWQLALRGHRLDQAGALARTALAHESTEGPLVQPWLAACRTLCLADAHDEAEAGLDRLLRELSGNRLRLAAPHALALRAELHLRRGRLEPAERDVAEAERALHLLGRPVVIAPFLRAVGILVDLESGRRDRARERAADPLPPGAEGSDHWAHLLFARAAVALGSGSPAEAGELLRESGRRLLSRHQLNPALLPWRSLAALASHALGDRAEAARLSEQEVRLARRWGAPTTVGWAELSAQRVADRPGRLAGVRSAAGALRCRPAGPGYVRALAELAAVELAEQGGDRKTAERSLEELSVLTARHPAGPMAVRARDLAGTLDDRTGRPADPAWDSLSPTERHTAELAGRGHSNRDIAAMLSVSSRAVELRLRRAYRKLGIDGRPELRVLVRAMEGQ
ncbi:helix-turn-helix transcriptional regulator [Kitasatospora aureofaciens]|uniref:helix-turn-helix transcriptional regulator n=1 Tax=Kitasatospora aureofaciens TaxID=1894 RepID=UPI0027DFBA8F|nr:helix-turn-helix transcriptional regulator [Kitasatospora aureofaciens]